MKYRTVKMGEVMPRNTEILFNGEYVNYYDMAIGLGFCKDDDPRINFIFNEDQIRVPIEESEVVE